MAPRPTSARCPLLVAFEEALMDFWAPLPLVLPSDADLSEALLSGDSVYRPIGVHALCVELRPQRAFSMWVFDRPGHARSAHTALRKAEAVQAFDAAFDRLDVAAQALAPGLWRQVHQIFVVVREGDHPVEFCARFVPGTTYALGRVRAFGPDAFVRLMAQAMDAARGVPAGDGVFRIQQQQADSPSDTVFAASAEDAALLRMVMMRAGPSGSCDVRPPHKVVEEVSTQDNPRLQAAAERLNALPFG